MWWKFFLTLTPLRIFVRGVIFQVRVQSLNKHTEVSFCPILIIGSALESWDPMEFKKISLILCASTRHKIGSELLTPMFWPFCVQNARKKKMTYFSEFYGTSAFQRILDDQNRTKNCLLCVYWNLVREPEKWPPLMKILSGVRFQKKKFTKF